MYRKLILSLAVLGFLSAPALAERADPSGSGSAGQGGVSGQGSVDTSGASVSGSVTGGPGGGSVSGAIDGPGSSSRSVGGGN